MPYYYYYGFDWTYLALVLPCLILSLWASSNVNSTFRKYSKQYSLRRLTGAEAALRAGFSIVTAGQGKEEKLRLCDPLDILQRAEKMEEEREEFLMELETGIRISNATTYVTV